MRTTGTLRGRGAFNNQVSQYGFPVFLEQTGTTGFATIQEAFNSASSGNTIKLTDTGTYNALHIYTFDHIFSGNLDALHILWAAP